ncbi:GntR family transcriptional regulator [Chromohalobacter nigrandesensis]|uniref:GntR family transcriptional regulator n=1 Tax=Chromohalobacter nigrandesensis TaxID=119863 RepID=UPI001FF0FFF9|nr:GntR family transcriptional regulator [Chromohalobacter nigrandesensis]MCK0745208.1 GntR family transcriptional regulator [Chromohalobacter nigrandesensis]
MPEKSEKNGRLNVIASLRKLISEGVYAPGERLKELHVAERLQVSRMPVRLAFRTLEQEGLLQKTGTRGYVVRQFSEEDVLCAVEVRGALEGLAARRLAEQGVTEEVGAQLRDCLSRGEALLEKGHLVKADIEVWATLNQEFHRAIVGATGSRVIHDAIARNDHLPFASADSIIIDDAVLDREYGKLRMAHAQHQLVFQALSRGEGARAEMLMREHAYIGLRYGTLFGLGEVGRASETT